MNIPIRMLRLSLIFLLIFGSIPLLAKNRKEEKTDPLDPASLTFLDVDLENLYQQAMSLYALGRYEAAASAFLAYLQNDIRDSHALYALASCYGRLGKAELAAAALERSVRAGLEIGDLLARDRDFDPVRTKAPFLQAMQRIETWGRRQQERKGHLLLLEAPTRVVCRIHIPEAYSSESPVPLVIGLHGYRSSAEIFASLYGRFRNPNFIYVALQAPYLETFRQEPGFSWIRPDANGEELDEDLMTSEQCILAVLARLQTSYSIDQVFLLGFSQGAALALRTGLHHPDRFSGTAAFGGGNPADWISEDPPPGAKKLPILIAQGREDLRVSLQEMRKGVETMSTAGYRVSVLEFEGGHDLPADALESLQRWMKGESLSEPGETK
ncbi:MAG TPA: alpha/beta hydrolase-fold protein [Thermoanaerobaculia bacterium]|nr:alpha/beta hydrolase-fold protein [Thermoanaerobaculia bacterium]HUM29489.1 alpha/beta hydrolase-fold protein [Thermoanaerobaculia bacterium]HXK67872.1 alpha/beta hydrolase-fold protein [Thermoanaerobaculia bacterium]